MRQDMNPGAVARLVEENDTLRETVRQLQALLRPPVAPPAAWKLTPTEADFLLALRAGRGQICTDERMLAALYTIAADTPAPKILDVLLCKVRAKLRRAGVDVEIETVWGRGWRMNAPACARFDALVAEATDIAAPALAAAA